MRAKVTEDQGSLQQPQTGCVLHAGPKSVKAQLWDLQSGPGGSSAHLHGSLTQVIAFCLQGSSVPWWS